MIKVKNLSVKYSRTDDSCALHDVSFSVEAGEKAAIIGANGAGKSTLLLALCGVIPATYGEIYVDDILLDEKKLSDIRNRMGMVFQNPDDQLFMPTVYEDVAFGPRNYGHNDGEIRQMAEATLEKLGILHLMERMSHKLSGGEKRLAALAGVLVMQPSVLLMDEPSAFLDPRARRVMINILNGLPHAMLIATHDLDMAMELCGRVIVLKQGTLYADSPAGEALRDKALLEECALELPLSLMGNSVI